MRAHHAGLQRRADVRRLRPLPEPERPPHRVAALWRLRTRAARVRRGPCKQSLHTRTWTQADIEKVGTRNGILYSRLCGLLHPVQLGVRLGLYLVRPVTGRHPTRLSHAVAGGLAGVLGKTAVAPLSRVCILMQVQSMRPHKSACRRGCSASKVLEFAVLPITWVNSRVSKLRSNANAGLATKFLQPFPVRSAVSTVGSGPSGGRPGIPNCSAACVPGAAHR